MFTVTMSGRLPLELLDVIFCHLHGNDWELSYDLAAHGKYELDSCSRVSRLWNVAARPHLFRDVVYSFRPIPFIGTPDEDGEYPRSDPKFKCFSSQHKPAARFKTFPMFYSFIQRSPVVQGSIRRLRLNSWPRRDDSFFDETDRVAVDAFLGLLRLLPQLRVLHLYNFGLQPIPPTLSPILHPSLRRVLINGRQSFKTVRLEWQDLDVAAILDCFLKVEELELNLPDVPKFLPHADINPPIEVNVLILGDAMCLEDGLQGYLFDTREAKGIRSLHIKRITPDLISLDLLDVVGTALQQLKFTIPHKMDFGEWSIQSLYAIYCQLITLSPGTLFAFSPLEIFDVCVNVDHVTFVLKIYLARDRTVTNRSLTNMVHFINDLFSPLAAHGFPHLKKFTLCLRLDLASPTAASPTPEEEETLRSSVDDALFSVIERFHLPHISLEIERSAHIASYTDEDIQALLRSSCPRLVAERKLAIERDVLARPKFLM